jgi:hypothetical protein
MDGDRKDYLFIRQAGSDQVELVDLEGYSAAKKRGDLTLDVVGTEGETTLEMACASARRFFDSKPVQQRQVVDDNLAFSDLQAIAARLLNGAE